MTTSQAMWPRHYAAAIVDGVITIEGVPEHMRELVESYLRIRAMPYQHQIEGLINHVLRGEDRADRKRRLDDVPIQIKKEVEAGVRAEWQRRAEA